MDQAIEPYTDYNVASGATVDILLPTITVNPAICFSVSSFEVVDAVTGAPAPEFLSSNETHVSITTEDRAYVGMHTLSIRAHITISGQILYAHDFKVQIYDPCEASKIVDNSNFPLLEFQSLQPGSVNLTSPIFTDTVSVEL